MVVPSSRDLGAAIVTAAGCLAWWGVEKFAGWLSASTPASLAGATLARWQWVNIAAFAVNVVSVAIPGRIDDEMAEQMKKEAKARKKRPSVAPGVPKDSIYRSLVTPAGWAFLIWPVIYLAESVFTAAQASDALDSVSTAAYSSAAPWWLLACALQSLWCVAFRDWAKAPEHFWISGALLAAESVALGRAVHAVDAARVAFPSAAYWCGRFPLALHHGWITAAAVVNVNSWLAVSDYPNEISSAEFQARAAFISHAAAAFIGCRVSWMTKDPTFAGVIAWALYAIAADGGWRKRLVERIGEEPLRAIARNALFHARVASALCVYLAAKPLVDPYLPDAAAGLFSLKR
mmetsp:Transcript_5306/g.21703  ORF Transcript_5306/g.21703 Transcript_5306/m.21703 type:complete len:347 (-) Transcript_5306:38-1078(-)